MKFRIQRNPRLVNERGMRNLDRFGIRKQQYSRYNFHSNPKCARSRVRSKIKKGIHELITGISGSDFSIHVSRANFYGSFNL